jgi:hypothetical protein
MEEDFLDDSCWRLGRRGPCRVPPNHGSVAAGKRRGPTRAEFPPPTLAQLGRLGRSLGITTGPSFSSAVWQRRL